MSAIMDLVGFGPHPDDVELTSGGLFLRMADQGYKTAIVDLTRGEAGTRGTPETRAAEAAKAASMLKVQERINLGLPDGEVMVTREAKREVARVVRALRPKMIVIPFWQDSHPDHANASRLVSEGAFIAGLRSLDIPGEPWRPKLALHAMYHQEKEFTASFVVDITKYMAAKLKVAECYASQFYNPNSTEPVTDISRPDFLKRIEARGRMCGDLIGVEFGEAYMSRYPVRIDDPVKHYETWTKYF